MATDALPSSERSPRAPRAPRPAEPFAGFRLLNVLASLRLTIALLAMAIFLILVGTLAQIDHDIWYVVRQAFFRVWIARVDFQLFFPRSMSVPGYVYFPGGALIGLAMAVNLIAAHLVRFKVQATGGRLVAGLMTLAAGFGLTYVVVLSGMNIGEPNAEPLLEWATLWKLIKVALALSVAAAIYPIIMLPATRKGLWWSLVAYLLVGGGALVWLLAHPDFMFHPASMRILWQLVKASSAGLVLLAACELLFHRRAGVVLIHVGIAMLMLGELLVAKTAEEGMMFIREGQTAHYVEDLRAVELAVIDASGAQEDRVVAIPASLVRPGALLRHEGLPFQIKVTQYFANAALKQRPQQADDERRGWLGTGADFEAQEMNVHTGVESGGRIDFAAATVECQRLSDGAPLGKLLLAQEAAYRKVRERIEIDGKPYDLALRFKRTYMPYALTLKDVRTDYYPGTRKPRNYSSDVTFVDSAKHVSRDIKIWMNNPLRYEGETFYQSRVDQDTDGTEMTGLQVVQNSSWMLPYVACMVAAIGMASHFSRMLPRVFRVEAFPAAAAGAGWTKRDWIVAASFVALLGAWFAREARPGATPAPSAIRLAEFGQLPAVYEGRIKPLDSVARTTLQALSAKQTFLDEDDRRQPAIQWLLDAIARPEQSRKQRIFRITSDRVLGLLQLEPNDRFLYSVDDILPQYPQFETEVTRIRRARAESDGKTELPAAEMQILETSNRLGLFMHVVTAMHAPPLRPESLQEDLLEADRAEQQMQREESQPPRLVPPAGAEGSWSTYRAASLRSILQRLMNKSSAESAVGFWEEMIVAYSKDDAPAFNSALAGYQEWLTANRPADWSPGKLHFEQVLNQAAPFYHALVFYVCAALLALLAPLAWRVMLNRAALAVMVATFGLHTFGIVARIYVSGRPPVTNLYSSALFVGWAGVLAAIFFETRLKNGVGTLMGGLVGGITLLIAHNLAADGDTLNVMEAVLDTTFWLATHVVIINLGYAATAVAGVLGLIHVSCQLLRCLSPATSTNLYRSIYGTLCFAILFSLIGTVLGGLWADDSWGRFWGWDPKENGALIIVLWNALVLHARWAGIVRERGLALLAVAGNIAVTWSWFGTNQLGIGLHSYGFREGTALAIAGFVASQLLMIGLGLWATPRPRDSAGISASP